MQANGYWLKNTQIIEIEKDLSHIKHIIADPDFYETDIDYIKNCYEKYGEQMLVEGKAREEINLQVIGKGAIRIRQYVKPVDYWAVQCSDFDKSKPIIINFIVEQEVDVNSSMIITDISANKRYDFSFMNGGIGKLLESSK